MKNLTQRNQLARFFVVASLCPLISRADLIVLKNGDRITGSIVKKDGASLTIKSDLFGVITAPWDKVESVKADTVLNVSAADGEILQGTLNSTAAGIEVASGTTKSVLPAAEIRAIRNADEQKTYERMLSPGWGQLWAGSATVGWAGSKGNAETQTFTTGANAQRVTKNDKTVLHFNAIKASAFSSGKNSSTAQEMRGGLSYDHNISSRIFINTFNDYEYDKFQNLDLRFVIGGGLGYQLVKNAATSFSLVGGAAFNRSSYSTPAVTQSGEGYLGDDYSRKLGKAASFIQTARIFSDLSHPGNYRVNFDAGTSVRITKGLNWNVSFSDRYVTPAALGRKSNDILYTTGLGFTFAR
jgi:putative salt-induced outer membrane protein YdiY